MSIPQGWASPPSIQPATIHSTEVFEGRRLTITPSIPFWIQIIKINIERQLTASNSINSSNNQLPQYGSEVSHDVAFSRVSSSQTPEHWSNTPTCHGSDLRWLESCPARSRHFVRLNSASACTTGLGQDKNIDRTRRVPPLTSRIPTARCYLLHIHYQSQP